MQFRQIHDSHEILCQAGRENRRRRRRRRRRRDILVAALHPAAVIVARASRIAIPVDLISVVQKRRVLLRRSHRRSLVLTPLRTEFWSTENRNPATGSADQPTVVWVAEVCSR